jgi:hypothetical protein
MSYDFRDAFDTKEPIKTIATISTNFVNIEFPDPTKRITVGCKLTDIYLSFSYSDGDSGTNTNSAFVEKNRYFEMNVPNGLDCCQIASTAGNALMVTFIMEDS